MTRTASRIPVLVTVAPILALVLALAAAPRASAGGLYIYTASALLGAGGSVDADPGDGFGNTGYQLGFSYTTEPRTRIGVRAGQMGLGDGGDFANLHDADLTYATISGEYLFAEPYYDSWVFLGLGYYRLGGNDRFLGGDHEQGTIGGTLGISGEFQVWRQIDFVVELSGHYADFDQTQIFGMAHAGVSFHF